MWIHLFFSVTKTKDAEIQRLVNEAAVTKNHLMQIGARLNLSNKKIAEHESTIKTLQAERDNAKAELERVKTDVQTGAKTQVNSLYCEDILEFEFFVFYSSVVIFL